MSHRISYLRTSTGGQSVQAQRGALTGPFDAEFVDEGVSGAVMAADRPGFADLLKAVRSGDTLCVYALDRLGRDALDVQATVRLLLNKGVAIDIRGIGLISTGGVSEVILAVLAQLADLERNRIKERCDSGRAAARESLAATGKTHRGKESLGRPFKQDGADVVAWRKENTASIKATAAHFKISTATVKRYAAEIATA
jgi:putative DNA-invertase from lambdoid prophage Rac